MEDNINMNNTEQVDTSLVEETPADIMSVQTEEQMKLCNDLYVLIKKAS
jgi:hypothetical protein